MFFFFSPFFFGLGASLVVQTVKSLPAMQEALGSIPGSGRSPEEGNGNPLQYSCLENPMDQKKKKQTEPGGLQSLGHKESDITERTRRGLKALPCHWRLCGFRALRRPVWLTLPMRLSRQEYWSGLPWPSPGDLPNPGIKPRSPALQADALPSGPPGKSSPQKESQFG